MKMDTLQKDVNVLEVIAREQPQLIDDSVCEVKISTEDSRQHAIRMDNVQKDVQELGDTIVNCMTQISGLGETVDHPESAIQHVEDTVSRCHGTINNLIKKRVTFEGGKGANTLPTEAASHTAQTVTAGVESEPVNKNSIVPHHGPRGDAAAESNSNPWDAWMQRRESTPPAQHVLLGQQPWPALAPPPPAHWQARPVPAAAPGASKGDANTVPMAAGQQQRPGNDEHNAGYDHAWPDATWWVSDSKAWSDRSLKIQDIIQPFDGTTEACRVWPERMKNHCKTKRWQRHRLLDLAAAHPAEVTLSDVRRRLSNLNPHLLGRLSGDLWTLMANKLDDTQFGGMQAH